MKQSKMRKRQDVFKREFKKISNELDSINEYNDNTTTTVEKHWLKINEKVDEINTKFSNWTNELNLRIQVCQDSMDHTIVKFKQLSLRTEELDNNQKHIIQMNEKLANKINKQDNTIKDKIELLRNDMLELISKAQRQIDKQ
jgi:hypothetical protein